MEEKSSTDPGGPSCIKTREEIYRDREHELKVTAKTIIIPDWLEVDD
jgi:hypothetical protein